MKFQFLTENFSRSENAPPFETRKIRHFEVERIFLENKKMVQEIRDSAGRRHASSGYYSLTTGAFELEIPVARNDRTGYWTVICTDLIAGHRAEAAFRVNL